MGDDFHKVSGAIKSLVRLGAAFDRPRFAASLKGSPIKAVVNGKKRFRSRFFCGFDVAHRASVSKT